MQGPYKEAARGALSALRREAQEENRMGTMGRKDPWAGRPAPAESAMLPPGCVTLGKSLPLSGQTVG